MDTETDIIRAANAARGIIPPSAKEQHIAKANERIRKCIQNPMDIKRSSIRNTPLPSPFISGAILLGIILANALVLHIAGNVIDRL